ncbi:MAG: DUF563 domain-containing protein [Methylococcaceae bacterium]|nr:DUF563 domain-containing protein [Methylococcaceae bacterium]
MNQESENEKMGVVGKYILAFEHTLIGSSLVKHFQERCTNHLADFLSRFNFILYKNLYIEVNDQIGRESIIYEEQRGGVCASPPQYYYQKQDLKFFDERYIYAALLTNVTIFGSSDLVLLANRKVLYELFYLDENKNFEYTDAVIASCLDGKLKIRYKAANKTIENGIMFSGKFSFNYYHFIFETLAKFELLDKTDISKNVPLIIDEIINSVPQLKELLDYFNEGNREIIYLKRTHNYNFRKLYYLSQANSGMKCNFE